MHSLAIELKRRGFDVTGSDDAIYEPSKSSLLDNNLLPKKLGWCEKNIKDELDFVILGMHAKSDNIELKIALEKKIKVYSFPQFIYEHSKNKTRVVIGGSHGKTTITSMILHVLEKNNFKTDYILGAKVKGFTNSVHLSEDNEFIIIEGDEYLSSRIHDVPKFHIYKPNIALISGISWDHINVFPTFKTYVDQFKIFINKIINGGVLVYNENDENILNILDSNENFIRKIPYCLHPHISNNNKFFIDSDEGLLPIKFFGKHNMENLSAAKKICNLIGLTDDQFYSSIVSFEGAGNRLELVEQKNERCVIKDFAHSPSKLIASINAVKSNFEGKLIAVFELHTFSSFDEDFQKEYRSAFDECDHPIVFFDSNNEKLKDKIIDEKNLIDSFSDKRIVFAYDPNQLRDYLLKFDDNNVNLLLMSSGKFGGIDIDMLAKNFCEIGS